MAAVLGMLADAALGENKTDIWQWSTLVQAKYQTWSKS